MPTRFHQEKVLTIAALILTATSVLAFADEAFEQSDVSANSTAGTAAPDEQKIVADLIGHSMYVSETVPGIWEFSSAANIHHGTIGSSRLKGKTLEYNFTMLVAEQNVPTGQAYRAETLITCELIGNAWQLQNVREVSFRNAGTLESVLSSDC